MGHLKKSPNAPRDVKSDSVEFILTKTYFENLGLIMQEYLTTTSVGDLKVPDPWILPKPRPSSPRRHGQGSINDETSTVDPKRKCVKQTGRRIG